MYDDTVSIFVKARDDLLVSICDGHDLSDNIDEYLLAKEALEDEGFTADETWRERICDSFLKSEFMTEAQRKRVMAEKNINFLSSRQPWRGRVKTGRSHSDKIEVMPKGVLPYGDSQDHPFSALYDPSKDINGITGMSRRSETMVGQVLPQSTNHRTHARVAHDIKHKHDEMMRKDKSPHHTGYHRTVINRDGDEENGVFFHSL